MTTHHIAVGDIIEVHGRGSFEVVTADNAAHTNGVALRTFIPRCKACNQNDAYEGMPFCSRCINDAMAAVALREVLGDDMGEYMTGLARVFEWDNDNAIDARRKGQQYITLQDNASDVFGGLDDDELRHEIDLFISGWVRDAIRRRYSQ